MSTIEREPMVIVPPLVAGDRLDRATFHERYEAMPPGTRAELIGGVVDMPSPVGNPHGDVVNTVTNWIGCFRRGIAGLRSGCDSTVFLDDRSEPQPDIHLRISPEYGGQTWVEGIYLAGAPELVVEVSHSSRANDLGDKLEDYRRANVLEYLVVTLEPEAIHWFARRGDRFEPLPRDADGIYRSEVFPGLWLDPAALFADDLERLLEVVDLGRAAPEHAAFLARLREMRKP